MTAVVRGGGVDGTAAGDPAALPSTYISTLLALVAVHRADGRATVRSVAAFRRLSVSTMHVHLSRLRDCGLVEWDDRKHATLRPTVEVVA